VASHHRPPPAGGRDRWLGRPRVLPTPARDDATDGASQAWYDRDVARPGPIKQFAGDPRPLLRRAMDGSDAHEFELRGTYGERQGKGASSSRSRRAQSDRIAGVLLQALNMRDRKKRPPGTGFLLVGGLGISRSSELLKAGEAFLPGAVAHGGELRSRERATDHLGHLRRRADPAVRASLRK